MSRFLNVLALAASVVGMVTPALASPLARPATAAKPARATASGAPTRPRQTAPAAPTAPAVPTRLAAVPAFRPASGSPGLPAAEAKFVALINQERTRRGLRPLAWETTLGDAARLHSEEMARLDYFDHRSPVSGRETPADRWEKAVSRTPDEYLIAENLFFGSVADVAWGHRSLMESDGHRENILNPEYTRVGVGVHTDRSGQMWVTQMFVTGTGLRRDATRYASF